MGSASALKARLLPFPHLNLNPILNLNLNLTLNRALWSPAHCPAGGKKNKSKIKIKNKRKNKIKTELNGEAMTLLTPPDRFAQAGKLQPFDGLVDAKLFFRGIRLRRGW